MIIKERDNNGQGLYKSARNHRGWCTPLSCQCRLLDLGMLCQNSATLGVPQNFCVLMKARSTVLSGRNYLVWSSGLFWTVVEGDEGTLEVLKNCTVQPLFPGSRKSIPQLLDTQDREYFRPD